MLDFPERIRFQQLERQILELPLEPADPEPVRQRSVDLAGFPGDALLFLRLQRSESPHVVEPIGQLHQHHPDVAGHCQKHLSQVFRLRFSAVVEVNPTKLGDPFHQFPDLSPEVLLNLLGGDVRVLNDVVQETRSDHACTGADVSQQIRHSHRMHDVRVAAGTELPLVELETEIEG